MLFKKLHAQSGDQTYFGSFTHPQTHFGHPKLSGKCYITPLYPKLKSPFKKWVYAIDSFMRYGQFKSPVTRVVTPTPIFFYQVLISGIKMQKRRFVSSLCSRDILDLKILQSDWQSHFGPMWLRKKPIDLLLLNLVKKMKDKYD